MRRSPSLLLLACACAPVISCGGEKAPAAGGGGPAGFTFPVTFVEIGVGTVEERVRLVGDVESLRRAALAFERSGRVTEVLGETGQEVAAGAVLARLDASVTLAELASAEASVAAAQVDAAFAVAELKRAESLGNALAQSERDRWQSETALRSAQVARAEAEVIRLKALQDQHVLRAPFAGTLVARYATLGSHLQPGAPVFELVDTRNLEIRLELPAALVVDVQEGEVVTVSAEGSGIAVELQLLKVLPSADPGTRTFRGLLRPTPEAAESAGLMPGGFVRASLVVRRAVNVTVVPADALMESLEGALVVVAGAAAEGAPPSASFVPVRVLARGEGETAVESLIPGALAAGAQVIVTGNDNVFPGAPLRLQPHRAVAAR